MQSSKISKNRNLQHCAHNVFFGGPFAQSPMPLLKNGHLFFVHFRRAMPFLFWTFIESDKVVYLKGPQNVGNNLGVFKTSLSSNVIRFWMTVSETTH